MDDTLITGDIPSQSLPPDSNDDQCGSIKYRSAVLPVSYSLSAMQVKRNYFQDDVERTNGRTKRKVGGVAGRPSLNPDIPRPFPCNICGKRFILAHHLVSHSVTHTGVRPYPCNQCSSSFTQISSLKRHCQKIHMEPMVDRAERSARIAMMKQENRPVCETCGKMFKTKFTLHRHFSVCPAVSLMHNFTDILNPTTSDVGDEVPIQDECSWNGSIPESGDAVRPNKKRKRSIPRHVANNYDDCDAEENSREKCGDELFHESWDGGDEDSDGTNTNSQNYKDNDTYIIESYCNQSTSSALETTMSVDSFKSNERNNMRKMFDAEGMNSSVALSGDTSLPNETEDELSYEANMLYGDEKVFRSECRSSRSGTNHLLLTDDGRPFRCHECNRTFRLAHHLTNHMNTHTGARPYICFSCSQRFSQISSLKRHVENHCPAAAGIRLTSQQSCELCERQFINMRALKRHIKVDHTGEFSC